MKKSQKLALEASEKRQKLNELLALDTLSDEQRAELDRLCVRMRQVEIETRAAIVAEEPLNLPAEGEQGDPKLRELRSKVALGRYAEAALHQRAVDGAEAEFNAELKLPAGHFPLELLALETRATTNVDSKTEQSSRWLDRLFSETAAARLGVTFEEVAAGIASYPVTKTGAAAAQRGRTEAAADSAWTVGVEDLKPSRNAVRVLFSEEDALRLPSLESALRRDLNMALAEGVDRVIFVGDTGANEAGADIAGLTTASDVVEQTITQANKVKAAETLAAFLALVDGKHASMVSDLNCVLSVGAYRLWSQTIANSAAENQTILSFLKENGLTCSVRGDIDTATGNGDFGAFIGRKRGIVGAAVAAIWNSGMLIRDPYSGAAKGEVALTLSYFWNFGLPRPTNYARLKFAT